MAEQAIDGRAELARRAARLGVVRASELGGRRAVRAAPAGPDATDAGGDGPDPGGRPGAGDAPSVDERPGSGTRPPTIGDGSGDGARVGSASGPSPVLPAAEPLAGLLPDGGLRRGSTVAVGGSAALVLATLAEASRAGAWCALVGLPGLGVQAAAEAGLDLARTALVPRPGPRTAAVVAALVDGVDLVVLGNASGWRAGDRQRLAARVRQRGAVLLPVVAGPGGWPGADAELFAAGGLWAGLAGDGAGRLRSRRVRLRCAARGRAHDRATEALLPGPGGGCVPVPGGDPGPAGRSWEDDRTAATG